MWKGVAGWVHLLLSMGKVWTDLKTVLWGFHITSQTLVKGLWPVQWFFWTDYKLLKRKTMLSLGQSRRYKNSTVIITKCRHTMLDLTKWVILRIFYQKQELLILSENLGSPRFFGGTRIDNGLIVFCDVMFVSFVFFCPMLHVSLECYIWLILRFYLKFI